MTRIHGISISGEGHKMVVGKRYSVKSRGIMTCGLI
jgi:hypothetical protein